MGWTTKTYYFKSDRSGSTTLTFTSLESSGFGAALDDVSISDVPEPATWGMMIMGFGLVGGAMRTRKSRKLIAA